MAPDSKVYIAGVGFSPSGSSSAKRTTASMVSAATKALLDAGITYDDVTGGVKSGDLSDGSKAFQAFSADKVSVDGADRGSELAHSFSLIKDKGVQCVLVIAAEKSGTVALVLTSENFLWRHAFLKDSAILIQKSGSKSKSNSKGELKEVCEMVWKLRGWTSARSKDGQTDRLHYQGNLDVSFELGRADGNSIPPWKEVEHRQDGKYRLGYNPVTKTKEISLEDFQAVRGTDKQGKKADDAFGFTRKGGDRAALARL